MGIISKHPKPEFQLAQLVFIGFIILFTALTFTDPKVGLTGLGVTVILATVLIEVNRADIWNVYRKAYKKQKGIRGLWSEPNKLYYTLNVWVLWPGVALLGIAAIWAALTLA